MSQIYKDINLVEIKFQFLSKKKLSALPQSPDPIYFQLSQLNHAVSQIYIDISGGNHFHNIIKIKSKSKSKSKSKLK